MVTRNQNPCQVLIHYLGNFQNKIKKELGVPVPLARWTNLYWSRFKSSSKILLFQSIGLAFRCFGAPTPQEFVCLQGCTATVRWSSEHAKRRVWKSEEPTHDQKCRRPTVTDMMIVRPKLPRFAFDRPARITQIDGCNKFAAFLAWPALLWTWSIWSTEGFSRWTIRIS